MPDFHINIKNIIKKQQLPQSKLKESKFKRLTKLEIEELEKVYRDLLEEMPFVNFESTDYLYVIQRLKREKFQRIGTYMNITIFEAANRIASDLTLLKGVLQLFKEKNPIPASATVQLRLGTIHEKDKGDFSIFFDNNVEDKDGLQGEAFNVAFLKGKLANTLKKWANNDKLKYIVFNADCPDKTGLDTLKAECQKRGIILVSV